MVQALVTGGVGIYGFYALQPYLLDLYGDPHAYVVAGLSAAIVAGAQILGGLCAPLIRKRFRRRTSALLLVAALSAVTLLGVGLFEHFWAAIALAVVWALLFAASMPIRQTYLNGLIPSRERATILSFDSLMTSSGGVWTQPALGRAADAWSYPTTYLISAAITLAGLPFVALSRRQNARRADTVVLALEDEQVAVLLAVQRHVRDQLVELPAFGADLVQALLELLAVELLVLAPEEPVGQHFGPVFVGRHGLSLRSK